MPHKALKPKQLMVIDDTAKIGIIHQPNMYISKVKIATLLMLAAQYVTMNLSMMSVLSLDMNLNASCESPLLVPLHPVDNRYET